MSQYPNFYDQAFDDLEAAFQDGMPMVETITWTPEGQAPKEINAVVARDVPIKDAAEQVVGTEIEIVIRVNPDSDQRPSRRDTFTLDRHWGDNSPVELPVAAIYQRGGVAWAIRV